MFALCRAIGHIGRCRWICSLGSARRVLDLPIHGTLKARYEDFVVREVSQQGEVVELKDTDLHSQWEAWKFHSGPVGRLVLAKENRDVADAVAMLAKFLRLDREEIHFHGLKDRRAITYQHVSLPWHKLQHLVGLTTDGETRETSWDAAVVLGDLQRQEEHCRLGVLKGNHFTIVLRDVALDALAMTDRLEGPEMVERLEQHSESATRRLQEDGFVNYFGEQRFGGAFGTAPLVGQALLRGDFRAACQVLVESGPEATDPSISSDFAAGRFAALLAALPRRRAVERQLLRALAEGVSYEAAWRRLPQRQRSFFVRSFTSSLWNSMVSRRFSRYGVHRIFPGDVVDTNGRVGGVTSIRDVFHPLPGPMVDFQDVELREMYHELLSSKGPMPQDLDDASIRTVHFRPLLAVPEGLRSRAVAYEAQAQRLVLSAMDHIKGRSLPDLEPLDHAGSRIHPAKRIGLILEFQLSSSQYATVAVREFMQCAPRNAFIAPPKKVL